MLLLVSCATINKRDIRKQELTLSEFDKISFYGVGNLNIRTSDDYRLVITSMRDWAEILSIDVQDNTLKMGHEYAIGYYGKKPNFDIYLPNIEKVDVAGVVNIAFPKGNYTNLEINASGLVNCKFEGGSAENLIFNKSGVGNLKASSLVANYINIKSKGVGHINLRAEEELDIEHKGFGIFKTSGKYSLFSFGYLKHKS